MNNKSEIISRVFTTTKRGMGLMGFTFTGEFLKSVNNALYHAERDRMTVNGYDKFSCMFTFKGIMYTVCYVWQGNKFVVEPKCVV